MSVLPDADGRLSVKTIQSGWMSSRRSIRVIVTGGRSWPAALAPGTVVQAPAPTRLIEGGIPTEALVAQVAVARFADHQPLYRQAQMLARQGVIVDRSTLAFWVGYAAAEIAPVVARLREIMLASTRHLCRRDGRAGARPRARADEARLFLGGRA